MACWLGNGRLAEIKMEMDGLRAERSIGISTLEEAEERYAEFETSVSRLRAETGQLQQQHHDAEMQALKLAQLAERDEPAVRADRKRTCRNRAPGRGEVSRKVDAEKKLTAYQAELAVLERQVHEEKRARQIAEQFLNAQRQLVQNAGREMQEAVFQEKNCQHKIAEVVNSIRHIDDNIVELKAHLEKLQAEQSDFDETQLNSLLQEG